MKTTASGLQYKVEKEGKGAQPTANDTVTVNYRGTLINGTEFDSSYKRGQPATFPVSGVIKGWTEALQLMKVGSKYQLFIPSSLAYGERGAGRDIEPNSTLIFDVELLDVKLGRLCPGAFGGEGEQQLEAVRIGLAAKRAIAPLAGHIVAQKAGDQGSESGHRPSPPAHASAAAATSLMRTGVV